MALDAMTEESGGPGSAESEPPVSDNTGGSTRAVAVTFTRLSKIGGVMITRTAEQLAAADQAAVETCQRASNRAAGEQRTMDLYTLFLLHRASWAAHAGGDVVRVIRKPAANEQS